MEILNDLYIHNLSNIGNIGNIGNLISAAINAYQPDMASAIQLIYANTYQNITSISQQGIAEMQLRDLYIRLTCIIKILNAPAGVPAAVQFNVDWKLKLIQLQTIIHNNTLDFARLIEQNSNALNLDDLGNLIKTVISLEYILSTKFSILRPESIVKTVQQITNDIQQKTGRLASNSEISAELLSQINSIKRDLIDIRKQANGQFPSVLSTAQVLIDALNSNLKYLPGLISMEAIKVATAHCKSDLQTLKISVKSTKSNKNFSR